MSTPIRAAYQDYEFEDVTSNDLIAYINQGGTFTLNFPSLSVCGTAYTSYAVNSVTLLHNGANFLTGPMSRVGKQFRYNASHGSAVAGVYVLNAVVVDNTTRLPDIIDITFEFTL